ncbi:hypothetical protein PF003_g34287 [Phytophthora fragariae]|nr:hypothetical protein PF003_g34287 [Phytophthora fragariae]
MDGLSHAASNAGLLEGLRGNQASDQETEHDLRRALLCFCDFWLPALLSSYAAYVNFFKLALVNHANYSHGATKWNTAYTQRLLLDPVAQVFFFCLVFWVSASHCMAFLPVFLLWCTCSHTCSYCCSYSGLQTRRPFRL